MKWLDGAGFMGKFTIVMAGFFFGLLLTGLVFMFVEFVQDVACNYGQSREVVRTREC